LRDWRGRLAAEQTLHDASCGTLSELEFSFFIPAAHPRVSINLFLLLRTLQASTPRRADLHFTFFNGDDPSDIALHAAYSVTKVPLSSRPSFFAPSPDDAFAAAAFAVCVAWLACLSVSRVRWRL
jgi:hypothetical protein